MNVATLKATIALDDRDYIAGLKRSEKALHKFTAETSAAAREVERLGRSTGSSGGGIGSILSGVGNAARALGTSFLTLGRVAGGALSGILGMAGSLVGTLGNLVSSVFNLAGAVAGSLVSAFQQLLAVGSRVGMVFAGALAAGFAFTAKAGVDMNLTLAGARTALTQLIGSAPRAGQFLAALGEEAAQSIPTLKDLLPIATQLVQAYGPQGLAKVIPTIRAFGDAASIAAGGDTNRMTLALLGFRQILNRGVAQQEELNQIGENLGVNVTSILKRRFGTADTELLKKARVTGQQVADAIVEGLTRQFGGAQSRMARTIPGMWSNILDAFNSGAGRLTQGLVRSLTRGLEMALRQIQSLITNDRFMASLQRPFDLLGKAIEGIAERLPQIIGVATAAFETGFNFIRDNWQKVWDGVKKVAGDTFKIVMSTFLTFSRLLGGAMGSMGVTWEGIWEGIKTTTTGAIKLIGGGIAGVIEVFHELAKVQEDGRTGWENLGVAIKRFALDAIASMTQLTMRVLAMVSSASYLYAVISALRGDPKGFAVGLGIAGLAGAGFYNVGKEGVAAFNYIKDLDTSKLAGKMGKMTGAGGLPGAFSEGFNRFGTEFDARMAEPLPSLPGMSGVPGGGGGSAAPGSPFAPAHDFPPLNPWDPGIIRPTIPAYPTASGRPGDNLFAPVTLPDGRVVPYWLAAREGWTGGVGGVGTLANSPAAPVVAAGAAFVGRMATGGPAPTGTGMAASAWAPPALLPGNVRKLPYAGPAGARVYQSGSPMATGGYFYPGQRRRGRGMPMGGGDNVNVNVDVRSVPIGDLLKNDPDFARDLEAWMNWRLQRQQNAAGF